MHLIDTFNLLQLAFYLLGLFFYLYNFSLERESQKPYGFYCICIGVVFHTLTFVVGCPVKPIEELLSLKQSLSFFAWVILLAFILLRKWWDMEFLGVFILPLPILASLYAQMIDYRASELSIASRGPFLSIHILTAVLGYAAFGLAFILSLMYLLQKKLLKSRNPNLLNYKLPSLEIIDSMRHKILLFGFPLLTLAILSGAVLWARIPLAKHPELGLLSKEIWALLSWLVFAVLLAGRQFWGWRGTKGSHLAIVGFLLVVISFVVAFHSF